MDYESLWKEFATRMLRASEYGVSKVINIEDVLSLMGAYENHFKQLDEEEKKKELEDMGFTPIADK